ncbi:MAG: PIG-L family deacetylase [Lentisphaerae bacterium]|nr:PIG-L family deacetylase [Lentisphaerota bacterium]
MEETAILRPEGTPASISPMLHRPSQKSLAIFSILTVIAIGFGVLFRHRHIGNRHEDTEGLTPLSFAATDRILILAPHPDDEILGCGGVIRHAVEHHIPVRIVFLTYGDFNEWSFALNQKHPVLKAEAVMAMAEARRNEAISAAAELGLSATNLVFLGYPDGGTMKLWLNLYDTRKPYRHPLTKATAVPYPNAFRPGAPYKGAEIIRDLRAIFAEFLPTKVFVSHPADLHPDHKALYLFTNVVLWEMEGGAAREIYPYLVHFKDWPPQRGVRPEASLMPPSRSTLDTSWCIYTLDSAAVTLKRKALDRHATQTAAAGRYLYSFVRRNELFGDVVSIQLSPEHSVVDESTGELSSWDRELSTENRARMVGIEKREIALEKGRLSITLILTRPVAMLTGMSLYIFGQRTDRPFEQMPRLHIRLGATQHQVTDRGRPLPSNIITLVRSARKVKLTLPLNMLQQPERVFVGCRTYVGALPVDAAMWRIIDLPRGGTAEGGSPNGETIP